MMNGRYFTKSAICSFEGMRNTLQIQKRLEK